MEPVNFNCESKRQKLPVVRQIVKKQDDTKPWGQDAKAK
ncbi:hypothetical protein CCACVL1_03873, partial [Corchorus capsularis]